MRTLSPFRQARLTRLRFVEPDENGGEGGGTGDGGEGDTGNAGEGAQGGAGDDAPGDSGQKISDLPEWAQSHIKKLRNENASGRTEAKTKAAQEAREARDLELAKLLGLVKDEDTKLTPEQVQAKLDAAGKERDDAQASARQTKMELAVYRTASKAGGDPDALLDSRTFLEKVGKLDPSADGFTDKLTTVIKDAVKDNPKLKPQAGAGSSGAGTTGGSGEGDSRQPRSLADAVGGHYRT